jgi:hypothetical protein
MGEGENGAWLDVWKRKKGGLAASKTRGRRRWAVWGGCALRGWVWTREKQGRRRNR